MSENAIAIGHLVYDSLRDNPEAFPRNRDEAYKILETRYEAASVVDLNEAANTLLNLCNDGK